MQIFTSFVFPIITSMIAGIFLWRYHTKPKLFFHCSNIGYATIFPPEDLKDGKPFINLMHSLTISNEGQVPLKKVELHHLVDVSYSKETKKGNANFIAIGVVPEMPYRFEDDGKIIVFECLPPKDSITINYMYPLGKMTFNSIHKFSNLGNITVRSEQALGEPKSFVRQINIPRWLNAFLWILIFIGFWTFSTFVANLVALVSAYAAYSNTL